MFPRVSPPTGRGRKNGVREVTTSTLSHICQRAQGPLKGNNPDVSSGGVTPHAESLSGWKALECGDWADSLYLAMTRLSGLASGRPHGLLMDVLVVLSVVAVAAAADALKNGKSPAALIDFC